MRQDVQTLIDTLIAERDAIDQAIGALSVLGAPKSEPANVSGPKKTRQRRRTNRRYTDDQKSVAAQMMAEAEVHGVTLRRAAREVGAKCGIPAPSVNAAWRLWAKQYGVMAVQPEAVEAVEVEAVALA